MWIGLSKIGAGAARKFVRSNVVLNLDQYAEVAAQYMLVGTVFHQGQVRKRRPRTLFDLLYCKPLTILFVPPF